MKLSEIQNQLKESSLTRVWQHANSDRPFALFTAFRDDVTNDSYSSAKRTLNIKNNMNAASELKAAGFGYFYVDGHWVENQGTDQEVEVAEDSIFAIGDANREEEFVNLIVSLGKKYNQDAVLIKTSQGVHLYNQAGKQILELGKLVPGKLSNIYTKLRKSNNSFVFEAERDGKGFMGKMVELSRLNSK